MKGKGNRKSVYLNLSRGEAFMLKDQLEQGRYEGETQFNRDKRETLICLIEAILNDKGKDI